VDDMDRYSIPEDEAYQLLIALMSAVKEAPGLRFLLIGMDRMPAAVPAALGDSELTSWPSSTEVDLYIQRYCTLNNIAMSAAERNNWVQAVMLAAQETQESRKDQWVVAVRFLTAYVHPIKVKA
jgi:hypothetical protein